MLEDMATLDELMQGKIDEARRRLQEDPDAGPADSPDEPYSPDELREIFRKFRRLLGAKGNPGTVEVEGALRAGWIVASGKVEGYGEETFHVVMLTNGSLHYTSGELTGDAIDLTDKWYLGDSIPALEAKMPETMAWIMAAEGIDWEPSPTP
jgi:hypothetical protein